MSIFRALLALSCAVVAVPGAAQTVVKQGPPVLTIEEAVDEALQHNLSLFAARSSLSIADAQMITARLRPNPVASVSADHLDLLGTGFDETNNGGPPEMAVRVDVPVERGGKRDARIAVASAARSLAEAQFADAARGLRLDVTLACIDVLAAHASLALVRDNLRAFEDLARVNEARAVAGSIAPFESTRARVAMLQFRSTLVRAELDLAAATAKLRTLLGRPPSASLDVSGALETTAVSAPDATLWQEAALDHRPDLRALQLTEARSVADVRLQEALGKVDYSLGAEYRRQQGVAGRSNSLGFFFSAPLPIANRNQGEIARADAERGQAARVVAAKRAEILADVETVYHEVVTTRALVADIERDLLSPASHARETAAYTYRAGGTSLVELLDAQRAFNDTMQSYYDAQSSFRRAVSRLNAAVGIEVVK